MTAPHGWPIACGMISSMSGARSSSASERGAGAWFRTRRRDLLPELRGHGHAEVDRVPPSSYGHATVLRRSALGDVEPPMTFSRSSRPPAGSWDGSDAAHDAVDARADLERAELGREVDVRGAERERALDRLVDLGDGRRVAVGLVHVDDAGRVVRLLVVLDEIHGLLVHEGDRGVDGVGRSDPEPDGHAEREPKLVPVQDIGGVGDGYEKGVVQEGKPIGSAE